MKHKSIMVVMLAGALAASGCKKENKDAGSGSAAAGSGMAGSDTGGKTGETGGGMAGSGGGTMAGSDTGGGMAGSGGGTMAGSGGGAKITDAELEAVIMSMIKLFEDIGKATAGKDCKGAASGINLVVDANKAFFDKFAPLADDKEVEQRAEKIMEDKGLEKKLDAAAEAAMGPLKDKCADDADVQKAMERLDAIK